MKPQTQTAKHTQGPWKVDYSGPCRLAIVGPNGEPVALCNMQNEDGDTDEANARLIALSPDLLTQRDALLRACRLFLPLATDANCVRSVKWTTAREQARAAIALCEPKEKEASV